MSSNMRRLESSIGEQSGSVFASILTGFLLCAHRLSTPSRILSCLERVLIPKCTPFLNIQISVNQGENAQLSLSSTSPHKHRGGLQGRGASDTPHALGKKTEREFASPALNAEQASKQARERVCGTPGHNPDEKRVCSRQAFELV